MLLILNFTSACTTRKIYPRNFKLEKFRDFCHLILNTQILEVLQSSSSFFYRFQVKMQLAEYIKLVRNWANT